MQRGKNRRVIITGESELYLSIQVPWLEEPKHETPVSYVPVTTVKFFDFTPYRLQVIEKKYKTEKRIISNSLTRFISQVNSENWNTCTCCNTHKQKSLQLMYVQAETVCNHRPWLPPHY